MTRGPDAGNGTEPSVDTGYRIQAGDRFTLRFRHAGALGWSTDSGLKLIASLYFDDDGDTNDGIDTVIDSVSIQPRSNANLGETYVSSGDVTLETSRVGGEEWAFALSDES